jgi:hypothetical protein
MYDIISRADLIRILGQEMVERAESMPLEEYEEQKWERMTELSRHYDKIVHTPLFEARRSFLLGLDEPMKILLVRHIFETEAVAEL